MDVFLCVFFLSSSPLRSSFVSVVFDFNGSLNDVAPASVISFPVEKSQNPLTRLHQEFNYAFLSVS